MKLIIIWLQNGQKAQVWAFLLWKDTQVQQEGSDKDISDPWDLYQKWCKMDTHVRESWITAGKTIQTFTKISNAKMQDTPIQIQSNTNVEGNCLLRNKKYICIEQKKEKDTGKCQLDVRCFIGAKSIIVRKVVRNGQPEDMGEAKKDTSKSLETKTQKNESMEIEVDKKEKPKLKPSVKPKVLRYLMRFVCTFGKVYF